MMNHQLGEQPISNPCHDLLSAFRLAPSRGYSDLRQSKAVVRGHLAGIQFSSEDIHILNGDNIGYKKGGSSCGYNSLIILFQGHRIPRSRLYEIGIYSDIPREQLSREPSTHDLEELVEKDRNLDLVIDLATDLVDPTNDDFKTLTRCV